jgi:hypothetical protein
MATPEQWAVQEKFAPEDEDAACLLELRDRVERLELGAGIRDVAGEIALADGGWLNEASAAIREVAAWLRDNAEDTRTSTAIWMLEKEVEQ